MSPPDELSKALAVLKDYYGYDSFRPPQADIIQDVIAGRDVLVLMPTGGGKSLCYQIPAVVRPGVAIVVSPLIALMEDQVTALRTQGIEAAYYNSSLSAEESRKVLSQLHQGELQLLYIAPERLIQPAFMQRLHECNLALFAIDEAHCISQWGHDFRPEYAALGVLKQEFPEVPLIALTATADSQTREDIVRRLRYEPARYIASFNRPNIHYRVIPKTNGLRQVEDFLSSEAQQSGIIYCGTRDKVEQVAAALRDKGYKARAYHAGLSHDERREVQHLFRFDQIDVVVATLAFGMGIDKSNVRFVIHYDLPKNIESYYQETGRAGRDGLPAKALLLYEPGDSARLRSWIAKYPDEAQQRIESNKLNHMIAFAEATHCRRQILLNYFSETMAASCNYCDICGNPPETRDVTEDAQKFLSCVYRLRQGYGLIHVIEVLRGSQAEKVMQARHHELSTWGIGKDKSANYWKQLAWQLIHRDYCYQDVEQYNIIKLQPKAIALLKGEEKLALCLVEKAERAGRKKKSKAGFQAAVDNPIFAALRQLRRELAEDEGKPPFLIFSDATLHEMAARKPRSLNEMLDVAGVGQHKLTHYGEAFLSVLAEYA